MILGITGGIASGKSTVTKIFRSLGARVVSADELSREAVLPGSKALRLLVKQFGKGILYPDGTLNRKELGQKVFSDARARGALNSITHPAIAELAEKRLCELSRSDAPLVVYEAPLLFEAGAEGRVDAVLVVTVDAELQLRRLMMRDSLTEEQARARVAAQMSQEEKASRADFLIDNSTTLEALELQVERLFRQIVPGPGKTDGLEQEPPSIED